MSSRMTVKSPVTAGKFIIELSKNRPVEFTGSFTKTGNKDVFTELDKYGIDASEFDEIEFVYDEPKKMYIRVPAKESLRTEAEISDALKNGYFDPISQDLYEKAFKEPTKVDPDEFIAMRLAEYTLNNCK